MALKFTGSICLDTIPKECIKQSPKNGHYYVRIAIIENDTPLRDPGTGEVTSDHFITCAPPKDQRVAGRPYIFGNCLTWQDRKPVVITDRDVDCMPVAGVDATMPWELPSADLTWPQ